MSGSDLSNEKAGESPTHEHTCSTAISGFEHTGFPCICSTHSDLLTTLTTLRIRTITTLHLPATPWQTADTTRYNRGRPAPLPFPTTLSLTAPPTPLADVLLAYNTYLLDGLVRPSLPCGYQKSPLPTNRTYFKVRPETEPQLPTVLDHTLGAWASVWSETKRPLYEAALSTVRLRQEQFFHDGNHRTATLALYEFLAGCGIEVTAKPLEVYMALSLGEELGLVRTVGLVWRLVNRKHRALKPDEAIRTRTWREEVKMLPVWASLVYRLAGLLEDRTVDLERRRAVVRWLKREEALVHRCVVLAVTQDPEKKYQLMK